MLFHLYQEDSHLQMDWTVDVVLPLGVSPPWDLASWDIIWEAWDPPEIPLLVKPDEWVEPLAPRTVTKEELLCFPDWKEPYGIIINYCVLKKIQG